MLRFLRSLRTSKTAAPPRTEASANIMTKYRVLCGRAVSLRILCTGYLALPKNQKGPVRISSFLTVVVFYDCSWSNTHWYWECCGPQWEYFGDSLAGNTLFFKMQLENFHNTGNLSSSDRDPCSKERCWSLKNILSLLATSTTWTGIFHSPMKLLGFKSTRLDPNMSLYTLISKCNVHECRYSQSVSDL